MVTRCEGGVLYLDLSFGAGLAADRADHVTAVHSHHVIIQTEHSFVPGTNVDIVVNTRLHALEVHDLIPAGGETDVDRRTGGFSFTESMTVS